MRRQSREPRPTEWAIRSAFVPCRDGPRRLGQAFEVLLGPSSDHQINCENPNRSADHEGRDLRPGLD
jgi:hypothetical protein